MGSPSACDAVTDIYRELATAVDRRQPLCTASGRCCHFDAYGHRLYVTTLELAVFIAQLPAHPPLTARSTNLLTVLNADPAGCRFQQDRLCTVHAIRPFGCRIFYCDPTATDWQNDLYERYHSQLKQLHERFAIPYFYVEWRSALTALEPMLNQVSAP